MHWLADTVLVIHFGLAAFNALGLLLVPIGRLMAWHWVRHRRLRILHVGLIFFVALEALVGMTCPLTTLEAYLRGTQAHGSFLADQISRLLFWDLALRFFLVVYISCAAWAIWLWFFCRPNSK